MILSKSQIINNIVNEISDIANRQISPENIRHNLIDIIDSTANFILTSNISTINLSTSINRDSRLGLETLYNITLPGSQSSDNTAIGFNALKSNYRGFKNTAVGSYALSCNSYGSGNIAIGYKSLDGNTVGHTNIGIGMYTLHNNKGGQNNIAIGRGAGYYIGKTVNNKLFIANHAIDENYICNNPNGIGLTPLIHGDFETKQLGINVNSFHNDSALQVSGSISPSITNIFDIGLSGYRWRFANLSSGIFFGNDIYLGRGFGLNGIAISGNLIPTSNNEFILGSSSRVWQSGFFEDIVVLGSANINHLISVTQETVSSKNLYIAINEEGNGYIDDEELVNGGFGIKSISDEYTISFYPESSGLSCFTGTKNKSTWRSNIGFEVPSGSYIRTNSLVSYEPFNDNCYGLFFDSGVSYISRKNVLSVNPASEDGHIAGIGNVNFVSNSGEVENYSVSISSLESGVSVSQRFLTGTKQREKDATNENADKLQGFEIKYIDDSLSEVQGFLSDRLIIESYNNTSKPVNGLVIMKDSEDGAVCGITNISSITEDVLPATILNIRSDKEAIIRLTSETSAYEKSALQLLGNDNCEISGVEFSYLNNSGISDLSMLKDGNSTIFIRLNQPSGSIGILSSGITNEAITIGHSGISGLPVISLKDSTNINQLQNSFIASSGYGKIYNLYNDKSFAKQYNDLKFLDPSGNLFDLVVNKYDNIDARAIYVDGSGNTFGGYLSPSGRLLNNIAASGNTSYGDKALYSILSGSGNIAIGYSSLSGIKYGNDNIVIGLNSFNTMSSGNKNIVIGNRSFLRPNDGSTSGNIIIGHDGIGNAVSGSYNFLLGSNEKTILFHGTLGPNNNNKKLVLPSGGKIYLNNHNDSESLGLQNNVIEVIDSGGSDYPENSLSFKFTGNESVNLLKLDHSAEPLDNIAVYNSTDRPYAELNGDLKLRGAISFSDNTSLASASFLNRIDALESLIIEGYAVDNIPPPANINVSTSGQILKKNASWQNNGTETIVNRDVTCVINSGDYIIAVKINNQYRPIWISAIDTVGSCCIN